MGQLFRLSICEPITLTRNFLNLVSLWKKDCPGFGIPGSRPQGYSTARTPKSIPLQVYVTSVASFLSRCIPRFTSSPFCFVPRTYSFTYHEPWPLFFWILPVEIFSCIFHYVAIILICNYNKDTIIHPNRWKYYIDYIFSVHYRIC